MAQVKDVTTIADPRKRAYAERVNILCAKDCIMHRDRFLPGQRLRRRAEPRGPGGKERSLT